jgi:pimeloyl-ACP methyl ester carboxylesterase
MSEPKIHYEDTGGPGPAIVFSHGLLWSTAMYRFQIAAFRNDFRCVAYDHRGQGKSEITESGYDMDTLTQDAVRLIERLAIAPVHFVGLSMGGFVGMRLAARRPELVRSLVLIETASDPEPKLNIPKYKTLLFATKIFGVPSLTPAVMNVMFGKPFLKDPARKELRQSMVQALIDNDWTGTARAIDGVLMRKPVAPEELAKIRCPTMVISGELDGAVVPARSERTARQIPGARFVTIPRAGHTSSIEEPESVNAALREFWSHIG